MRTEIMNPVITCDRPREMATAKRILGELGFDFMPQENCHITIHGEFMPQELSELIKRIEREAEFSPVHVTDKIMSLTPTDLARVIDVVNTWSDDHVKTIGDVIKVLSQEDYVEEAQNCEDTTGKDYFKVVFGL